MSANGLDNAVVVDNDTNYDEIEILEVVEGTLEYSPDEDFGSSTRPARCLTPLQDEYRRTILAFEANPYFYDSGLKPGIAMAIRRVTQYSNYEAAESGRPLLESDLLVPVEELEFLTMSHIRARDTWNNIARIDVNISRPVVKGGKVRLGFERSGDSARAFNFDAKAAPRLPHQRWMPCVPGELNTPVGGVFWVRRTEMWVDLCVGYTELTVWDRFKGGPGKQPFGVYRIPAEHADKIELGVAEGSIVQPGDLLAMVPDGIGALTCELCADNGPVRPKMDWLAGHLRGDQQLTIRAVLDLHNRFLADQPPVPFASVGLQFLVGVPAGTQMTVDMKTARPVLADSLFRGRLRVKAPFDGVFQGWRELAFAPHLIEIDLGSDTFLVPITAAATLALEVGQPVAAGQVLGYAAPPGLAGGLDVVLAMVAEADRDALFQAFWTMYLDGAKIEDAADLQLFPIGTIQGDLPEGARVYASFARVSKSCYDPECGYWVLPYMSGPSTPWVVSAPGIEVSVAPLRNVLSQRAKQTVPASVRE